MSEHDLRKIHPRMPTKVNLGEISIRDGLQHEKIWIPTRAKITYLQQLALAGVRRLEATNLGSSRAMPQFKDAKEVFKGIRNGWFEKQLVKSGIEPKDIEWTAVTIREKAVDQAIELKKEGHGPDRVLMMVSTCEQHHFANSGTTLPFYWKEAKRCIKKCHDAGIKMCGTVSTIWGSPISGPTKLEDAIGFTKRWLDIGADDIEHADHDGSAIPDQVYRYFSMLLDEIPNPTLHIAHFHTTRGWPMANVLMALLAGIENFEGTLGGIGGQPTDFFDGAPVPGTGEPYYKSTREVGLISFEDMCHMFYKMGIDMGGIDLEKIIGLGGNMEETLDRRLRSGTVLHGIIPEEPREEFKKHGLAPLKKKLGEKPDQVYPSD